MSVVFVLVFAAIIMAGAFLIAFIWSVKNGQYEDTYTPSVRMLFDDPPVKEAEEQKKGDRKKETGEQKL
jgi:cbb3-type cytochrome oxidase maturation protein